MNETKIHPQAIVDFVIDNFDDKDFFVRNDKIRINTPFKCQNPKPDEKFHLAVFLMPKDGYQVGNWNCFRSNRAGTFSTFVKEIRKCSTSEAWKIIESYNKKYANDAILIKKFVSKEKELLLPKGISCVLHEASNRYLHEKRNLNNIDILKHNLYYCTEDCRYKDKIIIPFYENDKVVFFTSRTLEDDGDRYLHHYGTKSNFVYNLDSADLEMMPIVEGPFDAMMSNGAAIIGNQITEKQVDKIISKKPEKILVVMDMKTADGQDDKTCYNNTGKILRAFLHKGFQELYVLDPDKKYGFKDFGSLTRPEVQRVLRQAVPLTISTKLRFHIFE